MQTFLPYRGFTESARVLDTRRLGKQRVETIQVLRALTVLGLAAMLALATTRLLRRAP